MINNIIIIILVAIAISYYKLDFYKGLFFSIFLMILCPTSLEIKVDLGAFFPNFTIHRVLLVLMFYMWVTERSVEKVFAKLPLVGVMTLILISYGVSTLLSDNMGISVKRFISLMSESYLFFIVISSSVRKTSKYTDEVPVDFSEIRVIVP